MRTLKAVGVLKVVSLMQSLLGDIMGSNEFDRSGIPAVYRRE